MDCPTCVSIVGWFPQKRLRQTIESGHCGKAIESRTPAGSLITSRAGTISRNDETKKPCELQGFDGV